MLVSRKGLHLGSFQSLGVTQGVAEEDDPRVGGQWRIATLSRRGKRSPAAGLDAEE
jgi:hypothetical protein